MENTTKSIENVLSHEVIVLETASFQEKSAPEVAMAIQDAKPDIVAVQLCPASYRALSGQEEDEEIKILELLDGSKLHLFLIQIFLGYEQKKLAEKSGVEPGSDMLAAIVAGRNTGARVALVDRDFGATMERLCSKMGFLEKVRLLGSLMLMIKGQKKDFNDINQMMHPDIVSQLFWHARKISPVASSLLLDERISYISRNLVQLSKEGRILAVVGMGYKERIEQHLMHPECIFAIEELLNKPVTGISFARVLGFAVSLFLLIIMALVLSNAHSSQNALLALGIWFIVTGGLSALGVILARGHPLSALTALMVAWLTTLIPFVAAGLFAGSVEAWKQKPTVTDLKRLGQAESIDQLMENRLFRVILVTIMANLGSIAGMFLGVYFIWQRLGLINPTQLLNGIL